MNTYSGITAEARRVKGTGDRVEGLGSRENSRVQVTWSRNGRGRSLGRGTEVNTEDGGSRLKRNSRYK